MEAAPIRRKVPKIEPVSQSAVQELLSKQNPQSEMTQTRVSQQPEQQLRPTSATPIGLQNVQNRQEETQKASLRTQQISSSATAVQVPSRGFFYEDICPEGTIHLKPMTVAEEQVLTTARLVKSGEAIDRILSACIDAPKISIGRLLLSDKAYLIIALRQLSYGNNYEFGLKCPNCDENYTDTIDLSKLEINYLPEDFSSEDLAVTLPQSNHMVRIRLMTSGDEDRIMKLQKSRAKISNARDYVDETMVDRMVMSIVSVDEVELKQGELYKFVKTMSVQDSEALRDKIQEYSMGINTELISTCTYCQNENEIMMPIDANFFRATRRKSAAQRI